MSYSLLASNKRLKRLALLLLLMAASLTGMAQVQIKGRVTDDRGEPRPGVTVQVQGSTQGTATDANGDFLLSTDLKPGKHVLVFSAVGSRAQQQTITVGSQSTYTVNTRLVQDALSMDEVVVTGVSAGTTRRQLGSYVSSVGAKDLSRGATGNVLAALQGKTAGAQISQNSGDPAGGVSVRLRGVSSINSSSEPLYIVDGIIVNNATNRVTNTQNSYDGNNFVGSIGQNRMSDISPDDIERIEVLNGAAAAAIYGSRANAGVIQIFTKRGRVGKPQVSFTTGYLASSLRKKLQVNQAPNKFGGSPDVLTQDLITAIGTPPALPTTTTPVTRYDYQDYIFRNASGTDNNISVSGGNEMTKYYLSGGLFFNQGIIQNTDYRRFNFRANVDQTLNRWASVSMGLNYVNSKANEKPDGNSFFSPMNSVTILGNFHNIFERDGNGNIKAVGERGRINPVSVIEDFKQQNETNRVLANFGVKLKPMKGLSIDYTLGIDNYAQNGSTYMPPFAYNANTAFFGGGAPTSADNPTQNGYTSAANTQFFQINHDLSANYMFNITRDIGSTTQAGYAVQYERNRYVMVQGRGLAPLIQTIGGASTVLPSADERTELSISGIYLQQNFRLWNKIFLTGALRVDGSSVFGEDQRNQTYSKASASYLLSEESFIKQKLPWLNTMKLRVAYGESGNLTGIGAYERFNAYSSTSFQGRTALPGRIRLANEDVKPERQSEIEFGTDISVFNDRAGLTFNWYNKRVNDLLISRLVAPTTGYTSLLDNFGSLENKGIELVLRGNPFRGKDFSWNITAIYNRNRNKIVEVGPALTLIATNAGAPVALLEGYPIGVFYGTFFATDANGQWVKNAAGFPQMDRGVQNSPTTYTPQRDQNGIPVTTGTAPLRRVIGDPNPDWTGSLVNELRYKKLNLRFQLDAVQGGDVWNADFRTRQGVGNGPVADQEHRGELPRGYINSVYQIEEWRVDDGSFVKLREVALSYDFGKVGFLSNLTLSISGRNLISWDNYKGYDPELNAAGQSTVLRNIDFGAVPIPRTYRFGINARF
ncbi:MAG: SusC/RagA family TonB-linked outer membrane protein [Chitinophagaceae bacterium]|nr:MAG: SusC/RagA family TonB-linked outer membrane protein [Chitinophagaceae bacterium]